MGVTRTKERQGTPEDRRVKEGFSPRAFRRGSMALQTSCFWTSSLWDCEWTHFCGVKVASSWQFALVGLGNYSTRDCPLKGGLTAQVAVAILGKLGMAGEIHLTECSERVSGLLRGGTECDSTCHACTH